METSRPDAEPGPTRQGIGSVEMAARVLFALEAAGGPLTLNQIAQGCDSQPSKVHRYLVSLGRVGLTTQSHATGKYDLGPATRRLGGEALRRTNEVAIASEHTALLSEATGHSVNLAVWADDGPMIVRWDYGAHALSLTARVGASLSLLDSASGQVFFAHLPRTMTARALRAGLGDRTRADADALAAAVHDRGYGMTSGGVIAGQLSFAAPVFTATDALPLVMTLVFPSTTVPAAEVARVRGLLLDAAASASRDLGVADAAAVSS
jgi:DNA-binding IclR family transcriptional regulator